MKRGEERVTRVGRVQEKGLTVRKMRDVSFVEADGGKKEMNIDVFKCGIDQGKIKVILSDKT